MIVEMEFDFGEMAAIFSLFDGTLPATILLNRCTINVGRKGGLHPQSLE
jgi:hypothetical protein